MAELKLHCFSCKKEVAATGLVGRRDECPHCKADLHVCKNCVFFDEKVYNECKETQADVVREKERANFCDYFQVRSGAGALKNAKQDLLAAAEALFKKK